MKKLTLLTVILVLNLTCLAQNTEGYLQYNIDVKAADTTLESKQKVGMLQDSRMEIYFAEGLSRVDFKMGKVYNFQAIVDNPNNKSLSLIDGPTGKFAIPATADEMNKKPAMKDTSYSVDFTDETKDILGYNCSKAIVKTTENEIVYWYTEELEIDLSGQQIENDYVPGLPLEFSTVSNGIFMHYRASNIVLELGDKKTIFFTEIPVGYTVMPSGPPAPPRASSQIFSDVALPPRS